MPALPVLNCEHPFHGASHLGRSAHLIFNGSPQVESQSSGDSHAGKVGFVAVDVDFVNPWQLEGRSRQGGLIPIEASWLRNRLGNRDATTHWIMGAVCDEPHTTLGWLDPGDGFSEPSTDGVRKERVGQQPRSTQRPRLQSRRKAKRPQSVALPPAPGGIEGCIAGVGPLRNPLRRDAPDHREGVTSGSTFELVWQR